MYWLVYKFIIFRIQNISDLKTNTCILFVHITESTG